MPTTRKRYQFILEEDEHRQVARQARIQGFKSLSDFVRHRLGLKTIAEVRKREQLKVDIHAP